MPRDRENFNSIMDTAMKGTSRPWESDFARRGFLASDTADTPRVAVVNEQFAKHYWPGSDVVGKYIRLESRDGSQWRLWAWRRPSSTCRPSTSNGFCVYAG